MFIAYPCDGGHGKITDSVSPHSGWVAWFRKPRDHNSIHSRWFIANGHCKRRINNNNNNTNNNQKRVDSDFLECVEDVVRPVVVDHRRWDEHLVKVVFVGQYSLVCRLLRPITHRPDAHRQTTDRQTPLQTRNDPLCRLHAVRPLKDDVTCVPLVTAISTLHMLDVPYGKRVICLRWSVCCRELNPTQCLTLSDH